MPRHILGISAFYHDSAAALIRDGAIVAAAQEERFTRKKHDDSYPRHAIAACLAQAGIAAAEVDQVVFFEKPFLKFERLLETYLAFVPRGFLSFQKAMPLWASEKIFQKSALLREMKMLAPEVDWEQRYLFSEHHLSHAASAFYPSPFEEALVLTMDGVGEQATTSAALGSGNGLRMLKEIHFPHSLGLLYSAFTYFTGFRVNSGEYKVMGLAPYGQPRFKDLILNELMELKADGSFRLNMDYFGYATGLRMTNKKFSALFGLPVRRPDEELRAVHMDLAASIQAVTEEVVLRLALSLQRETGQKNLCLAGGVALNCVANGKLLRTGKFENIWVQPASGDAGSALGAALAAHHIFLGAPRNPARGDSMRGSYLGPEFSQEEIGTRLQKAGAVFHRLSEEEMIAAAVSALQSGKALGWHQGRMEFGPRALGNRSILADPRSEKMQSALNLKVKFRESFRPFAPAVLREDLEEWFELGSDSPYMLMVADVRKEKRREVPEEERLTGIQKLHAPRSEIPAVTHVDHSARIQTVHRETNPLFHRLISAFKAATGCPVLVNTSFNVRGEPIVHSPEDAFRCFMGTGIEMLVVGNHVLYKEEQPARLAQDYKNAFIPD